MNFSDKHTDPSEADAPTLSPLEFQQTSNIPPVPLYEWTNCPVCVDQICTHLSKLPDARKRPSGENATEYTGSLCLVNVFKQVPFSTSHNRTVESNEAEANMRFKLALAVPGPVGDHFIV